MTEAAETPHLDSNSFEAQFQHIEKIKTPALKAPVETVDITPENPEGNPVGYFLGWLGKVRECGPFYEGFYAENRRVVSNQYPTYSPEKADTPPEFSEYGYRNALAFVETAMTKGIKEIDLVGHSEGTSVALITAALLREAGIKVGGVVLVNPSGIENFKTVDGIKRLKAMQQNESHYTENNPELTKLAKNFHPFRNFFKHPLNNAREAFNVGKVDMPALIAASIENGEKIGIIQAANDPFVRYEELGFGVARAQSIARQNIMKNNPDILKAENQEARDAIVNALNEQETQNPLVVTVPDTINSGHLFNGFYPENPHFYVPLAVEMLRYFENSEITSDQPANTTSGEEPENFDFKYIPALADKIPQGTTDESADPTSDITS